MKTDLQIAQEAVLEPINNIAKKAGIDLKYLEQYGSSKAKVSLDYLKDATNQDGKLVLVTAINPTKAGEGKSTTTVGLVDGLNKIGVKAIGALREPSMGPVFGMKGGAAGGGYAQVVPMEDINLHFTGDMHAITSANNLISAMIDNHIFQGNQLNFDLDRIEFKRCLDMNDRALRQIEIKIRKNSQRKESFNITVASEIMAILCLADGMEDLKVRLGRILVGYSVEDEPIFLEQLDVVGAVALILKEAMKPNLVQTLENNPVFIHGGPFANIAHGCNSVLATKMALKAGQVVITEAGFGADLGAEKFLNIKCRLNDLKPSAIVLVATIRALKLHGGVAFEDLDEENTPALLEGSENLAKHIETIKAFNLPVLVALNVFSKDTAKEIETLKAWCQEQGVDLAISEVWEKGGQGAIDLATKLMKLIEQPQTLRSTYSLDDSFETKLEKIVQKVYGGQGVILTDQAKQQLENYRAMGLDKLPICMAKTQYSLSDDEKKLGRPKDFTITIREIRLSNGAGFLVCLTGKVMTMPGLPKVPVATKMDVLDDGSAQGLF